MKRNQPVGQGLQMTKYQLTEILGRIDEAGQQRDGNRKAVDQTASRKPSVLNQLEASNDEFASPEHTRTFRITRFGIQEGSVEDILAQIEQEKSADKPGIFSFFRLALLAFALLYVGYMVSNLLN